MTTLTPRFDEAVRYAREVHAGQTRKDTSTPYLAHLLGVSSIVLDDGGSEDEAIAGLLHDAAEDHGGRVRLEDIGSRFGDTVAKIVEDCTDSWETRRSPGPNANRRTRNMHGHSAHRACASRLPTRCTTRMRSFGV